MNAEYTDKMKNARKKLKDRIRNEINEAVADFEDETGVYVTEVLGKYHKDQKMLSVDVDLRVSLLLGKGIH